MINYDSVHTFFYVFIYMLNKNNILIGYIYK